MNAWRSFHSQVMADSIFPDGHTLCLRVETGAGVWHFLAGWRQDQNTDGEGGAASKGETAERLSVLDCRRQGG